VEGTGCALLWTFRVWVSVFLVSRGIWGKYWCRCANRRRGTAERVVDLVQQAMSVRSAKL
jgi:hypothetical protein